MWARSLDGSGSQLRTVTGLFTKQAEKLLTVTVAGEQVKVTAEHPFLVAGSGWLPAGMLRVGDRLVQRDSGTATIEGVSEAAVSEAVFNFEVEGDHNYYITQAQLLVHNCPIGGGASSGLRFRANTAHIFRKASGHLAEDNAENRALIQSAVKESHLRNTKILHDGSTLSRYYKTLPDGTQVWADVRNGVEITKGGLNVIPK